MIVVDTNVIAYLMIKGEFTDDANNVFKKDSDWIAPNLWKYEFLNILTTLINTKRAELNNVISYFKITNKLFPKLGKEPNFENVITISAKHKISAYDAQFVSLAMDLDIPLITHDKQLLGKFPDISQTMYQFIS